MAYGSEAILPSVLAAAVLGETGPVLAGLLVAGRMGAGLAAELGTMVLTEELDARDGARGAGLADAGRPEGPGLCAGGAVLDGRARRRGGARAGSRRSWRRGG